MVHLIPPVSIDLAPDLRTVLDMLSHSTSVTRGTKGRMGDIRGTESMSGDADHMMDN
mgnify:CR=1 FL=1|jgi:hypothetical protein